MITDKTTIDGTPKQIAELVAYVRTLKRVSLSQVIAEFGINAVEMCSQLDEIGVFHCPNDTIITWVEA